MCNNCIHKPVCSIYTATGGHVRECKHFREVTKKGVWVHPKGYVVSNGFLCSECGYEKASYHPINPRPGGCCIADENGNFYYPPDTNYCPNCGADMRGTEDGECM